MSTLCPACPTETRDLGACAHNAVTEYLAQGTAKADGLPVDYARFHRKMAELSESLQRWQPIVDAHFAAAHRPTTQPRREKGTSVRVCDLVPGDLVEHDHTGASATLLGWSTPHPRYPTLALVLWAMTGGGFSADALDPEQVVGVLTSRTDPERLAAIHAALRLPTGTFGS